MDNGDPRRGKDVRHVNVLPPERNGFTNGQDSDRVREQPRQRVNADSPPSRQGQVCTSKIKIDGKIEYMCIEDFSSTRQDETQENINVLFHGEASLVRLNKRF
ncbi:hypothetical protein KQX54_021089 [Cotesia glomerata]|uniref:Uncharacterized protein n=1 Tax=Cotesia glomerata TaxID=32391 RepID=A0AAV7J8M3_COTGL|nr:hypothetical protein KQX54_021089 [Cotesia glomerata]